MPFAAILGDMLDKVDGSLAAMFLDYEGEAVEIVGRAHTRDELRVIGAYEGIFLDHLRRICTTALHGRPERFKIDLDEERLFSEVLDDDYYIVLVLGRDANEAIAWRHLRDCRDALLKEI